MTRDRARKAAVHQHAQATGESYARAGRTLAGGDPPQPNPAPSPAAVTIEVAEFNGPNWGGDLHSHGVSIAITARADDGRGAWIGAEDLPEGVQVLEQALQDLPANRGPEFDIRQLEQLHQALSSQLPGCDIGICDDDDLDTDDPGDEEFYALQQAQDEADGIVLLFHTELTWDCDQPTCR